MLAELIAEIPGQQEYLKILLIEEPEAHLHPQLQIRLLKYLQQTAQSNDKIQIIVTTHSPVLASSVKLNTVIHLSANRETKAILATPIRECGLTTRSTSFLSRWLDATKSTLLFAKGIILVEGIAEALLIPVLAKRVIEEHNKSLEETDKKPGSLDELGISVVNMNGIYFKHFLQLFCNVEGNVGESIPTRCAGMTDNDPQKDAKPIPSSLVQGNNPALKLVTDVNSSNNCRLYYNMKTFEYDLAMEKSNLAFMLEVYLHLLETDGANKEYAEKQLLIDWSVASDSNKAETAFWLLEHIESKGEFAQLLAEWLDESSFRNNDGVFFKVPQYVKHAVLWSIGVDPGE